MPALVLRMAAPCAILARSQAAGERVYVRAAGRAFAMSGSSCRLDYLIADVQRAKSLDLPAADLSWLTEPGGDELCAFIERYLEREVEDDIRFRVEERVRDAWPQIARSLRSLDEPSPANVRARVHDVCRRERNSVVTSREFRLRAAPSVAGADPLDGVAASSVTGTAAVVEAEAVRALLGRAVRRASRKIPVPYNVWRLDQEGLTHEAIAEQLRFTSRTVRNHLTSFQAFVVFDLMQCGLKVDDLLQIGIKRKDLPNLIRKGRKFQRQKKQERSRRNEQH